jgi:AraC family transcriptional regulator, regulatory protein of adaptative response / DNA-3-methyladenine glycosylase II
MQAQIGSLINNLSSTLTHSEKLAYIREHRREFIGQVLIGVHSTGIYCLPTCTARQPKPENVRFYATESEAQAAGLRACRRCRPDYFYRDYDPDLERVADVVNELRRDPGKFGGAEAISEASGVGITKLHELFRQHYHTTPAAYLGAARIAAACRLLAKSPDSPIIDVAYTTGFDSLSAFHQNFKKATGLSPREYQRLGDEFTITLPTGYLAWVPRKLLGRDPNSITERVEDDTAIKAIRIGEYAVLIRMRFVEGAETAVHCRIEGIPDGITDRSMRHKVLIQAHAAIVRMLGLAVPSGGLDRSNDEVVQRLVAGRHGLRIPMSATVFEGIVWAIIGQQVNLAFAYKLRRAMTELCGTPINDQHGNQFVAHPTAEQVAMLSYDDLTAHQYSRRKAEYLIDTARLMASGELDIDNMDAGQPATRLEKQLLKVRGLGAWSVNYILMRAFGFADCVPYGDTGLTSALQRFFGTETRPDTTMTAELMQHFAPYRSLATYHLWMTLGENPA